MEFSTAARRPEPLIEWLVCVKRRKESAQESRSFFSSATTRYEIEVEDVRGVYALQSSEEEIVAHVVPTLARDDGRRSQVGRDRHVRDTRHVTVPCTYRQRRLREGRNRGHGQRETNKWARNIHVGESSSPPRASIRISFFSNSSTTYLRSRQVSSFISTSGVAGKSRTDKLTAATTSVSSECSPSRRAPFPPEPAQLRP